MSRQVNMILITAFGEGFRWHWDQLPKTLRTGKTDILHAFPVSQRTGFIERIRNLLKSLKVVSKYDVLLFHGHTDVSLVVPILKRLHLMRSLFLVHVEFNLAAHDGTLRSAIKYVIMRFVLGGVDLIFPLAKAHANYLVETLNLDRKKVVAIPQPVNYRRLSEYPEPHYVPDGYILALGRTGRDYKTLQGAIQGFNDRIVIVTSPNNVKDISFGKNVELLFDIPLDHLIELIAGAKYVIIPLRETIEPVGLRMLFLAMERGKAVIITKTRPITEYFGHFGNDSPLILVPPYSVEGLRDAIDRLNSDPRQIIEIGKRARTFVESNFTSEWYVMSVIRSILHEYTRRINKSWTQGVSTTDTI